MASQNGVNKKSFVAILETNDQPISEAVEAFIKPANAALKTGDETPLWEAWQDLTIIAQQTHHTQQEKLVAFVNEVRKQPGPLKDDGEKVKVWGQETSWESLPLLGPELREYWNRGE
jgi:hypothetical protein